MEPRPGTGSFTGPQSAPGGIQGNPGESDKRRTDLPLPELINELRVAIGEGPPLAVSPQVSRLLGTLLAELELGLNVHGNRFSRIKQTVQFNQIRNHPDFTPELVQGGAFVELGCGGLNPLANSLILIALGASEGIAIDMEPVKSVILAARALFKIAIELIAEPSIYLGDFQITREQVRKNLERFDLLALDKGSAAGIDGTGLRFMVAPAESTGLADASIDGLVSASFLEHVSDVDAVFAEMARISRPGAIGSHRIDGIDHRSYQDDSIGLLDFLTEDSDAAIVYSSNRIRPLEFRERFQRHGFEVLQVQTLRKEVVSEEQRAAMVEPFRSMSLEDLGTVRVDFAVRRK